MAMPAPVLDVDGACLRLRKHDTQNIVEIRFIWCAKKSRGVNRGSYSSAPTRIPIEDRVLKSVGG